MEMYDALFKELARWRPGYAIGIPVLVFLSANLIPFVPGLIRKLIAWIQDWKAVAVKAAVKAMEQPMKPALLVLIAQLASVGVVCAEPSRDILRVTPFSPLTVGLFILSLFFVLMGVVVFLVKRKMKVNWSGAEKDQFSV
ncbi:MAG: hypothetical protein V1690_00740 [Candidatus Moraniibacteriota bacterium]